MSLVRALVLAAVVAVGISTAPAVAQNLTASSLRHPKPTPVTRGVPEISAAGLGGVAALLIGGVVLFGTRRSRRGSARQG